jgi:hypothetical protein
MRGRSSKAWVQRGMSAAGRNGGRNADLGRSYMSAAQYDRQRKDAILHYAKTVFANYPPLEKTGELKGGEVKYLVLYYKLSDSLVCSLSLSNGVLMPELIGKADEVNDAVAWLCQREPALRENFRVYEPRDFATKSLEELGSHNVKYSGKFLEAKDWDPFLRALQWAIARKQVA